MAEIQYQVDEMLFKMNALAGTSNLPEKPAMYFTDSDTTCIGNGEEISSSGGSSAVVSASLFIRFLHSFLHEEILGTVQIA